MKIIKAGYEIIGTDLDDPNKKDVKAIYRRIELAGRTCYKSENRITDESARKFVQQIVANGHEAMLEHAYLTVKFTVDRGVSHELVRHRLASFAQESTRYCNYSSDKFSHEVTFVQPFYILEGTDAYSYWREAMLRCEDIYLALIDEGMTPEQARCVLPNSLKTEVVVTANMREWRHILKLRAAGTTGKPHPQMLEVMVPLLNELRDKMPDLFWDIIPLYRLTETDETGKPIAGRYPMSQSAQLP